MNKKDKMPKLSDILRMVDRNKVLSDLKNKYNHSILYNTSRTVLKYIKEDVELTAYAYNPGNAVVIFPKKNGLIAYSCYFEGFPNGESYSSFRWTKMKMAKAISLIKQDIWEESGYIDDAVYEDTSYPNRWVEVASGQIEYTLSYQNSPLTINDYQKAYSQYLYHTDYVIYRLISGKLRIEIDGQYHSYDDFVDIILMFRNPKTKHFVTISQLPILGSWKKVLSISDLEDNILNELKVQVISKKMKDAA
ncbi:MAG: hypothetical protein KAS53_03670 [Candidatus Cloacimonetes bacterium]|nr:hypothetical protein [Candidatus Cloacimonadota bacterium]